jgi:hypothetical protein
MKDGMMFIIKSGMKVNFIVVLVLALSLSACPNPGDKDDGGDNDPPPNTKTTLTINNLSDYALLSVEYAGVSFGDIRSGAKMEKEVPAGTQSLFFTGKSANGDQHIKLRDVVICEKNEATQVDINNNAVIILVESETSGPLKTILDEIFPPFEGIWIYIDAEQGGISLLFISGDTIEFVDFGRRDHRGIFTYTDSKIVFEFQAYYNGIGWEYYPFTWTEEFPYSQDKTQITWFGNIYKKNLASTAVLMNKLSDPVENLSSVIIELRENELISPVRLDYGRDITITIKSNGGKRYISYDDFSTAESLFTVGSGTTLVLEDNVIIVGNRDHGWNGKKSLITIEPGGKLILKPGAKVLHHYSDAKGGGVYVGGSLDMQGGEIIGNYAAYEGGGVYVAPGGIFNMAGSNARIRRNRADYDSHEGNYEKGGGGVSVDGGGTFTMTSGEISENDVGQYTNRGSGGGVYTAGTFTMEGGKIDSNKSIDIRAGGGGVYVAPGGVFNMTGTDAVISNNISQAGELGYGGGVYVYNGTFIMTNGVIKGNKADGYGGGVYASGTFKKMPGGNAVIYGQTFDGTGRQTEESNSANEQGDAVYSSWNRKRETTAGPDVALDSAKDGAEGGWE